MFPDGGISRLRLRGVVTEAGRDEIIQTWHDLLPAAAVAQIDAGEYFA